MSKLERVAAENARLEAAVKADGAALERQEQLLGDAQRTTAAMMLAKEAESEFVANRMGRELDMERSATR